jgi:hypothetical protein
LLGDLPLFGHLFRFDSVTNKKTELLIIMTPHIVRNEADAEAIKRAEAARMSWCLRDITTLYGEAGLRKRTDEWSDAETKVIYPDLKQQPGSLPSLDSVPEPVPAPAGAPSGQPAIAPQAANPPLPTPSRGPRPAAASNNDSLPGDPNAAVRYGRPPQQAQYPSYLPPAYPNMAQPAAYQQPAPGQQPVYAPGQQPVYPNTAQPAVYQQPALGQQ